MANRQKPVPYTHTTLPCHLYGPGGVVRVCKTEDEYRAARDEGFADHPRKVGERKPKRRQRVPNRPAEPEALKPVEDDTSELDL